MHVIRNLFPHLVEALIAVVAAKHHHELSSLYATGAVVRTRRRGPACDLWLVKCLSYALIA